MIGVFVDVLLPISAIVLIGFLLKRNLEIDLGSLNRVSLYGFSPTLIFISLVRTDMAGGEALRMILLALLLVIGLAALVLLIAWPFRIRHADLSALLICCMFMNAGNYGLPAAAFAFGEAGFERAVLFFIPQAIMAQVLGVGVAAAGGAGGNFAAVLRTAVRRVLRMPHIYAVSAALLVRSTGFDPATAGGPAGAVFRGLVLLGEATLPLLLTILGMQLARGAVLDQPGMLALAIGIRLVVSPLLALLIALALGMDGLGLGVAVMLAGMPTAVNTTILAIEFNARPTMVVATVIFSTLLSLLTLSLILALLRG